MAAVKALVCSYPSGVFDEYYFRTSQRLSTTIVYDDDDDDDADAAADAEAYVNESERIAGQWPVGSLPKFD